MVVSNDMTLARLLSSLYTLSHPFYTSQVIFFSALFRSFTDIMTDRYACKFEISQSICSQIFSGQRALPRDAYYIYTAPGGDELLRSDVSQFLSVLVVTSRQNKNYINTITKLVNTSNNLEPEDKMYILSCLEYVEDEKLATELIFRALRVVVREPIERQVS